MTFSQLRCLDVINICDGRKLGKPMDIVLTNQATIEAIVVPMPGKLWQYIKADKEGYVVPWQRIRRIGDDVILVDLPTDFFV